MSNADQNAFFRLFQEAYEKCFAKNLEGSLTETESKHLSNEILEQTGLIIGWKSIKNYSFYILNSEASKQENPSVATLDTLARYVSNAPKTDEAARKRNEGHFSYWYNYRDAHAIAHQPRHNPTKLISKPKFRGWLIVVILLTTLVFYFLKNEPQPVDFADSFNATSTDSLLQKGWILKDQNIAYWNKRNEKPGYLTLFTLDGDNYVDTAGRIGIKNLLLKEIKNDCFSTEIYINDFIPNQNWQQVGLLLMEDTTYSARSIRISLSFNDFFGGYTQPGEILLQVLSASDGAQSKPEEIAHTVIFSTDTSQTAIVKQNLQKSALRIEKQNNNYRFLYATGQADIFAFKEITSRNLPIKPRYLGIFALKGFKANTSVIPVYIDSFSLKSQDCND